MTAQKLKQMGVTPGWPDFLFTGPRQQIFWLELKRERKGRASDAQLAMEEHLEACGFDYLRTASLKEAVVALKLRGVLICEVAVM